MQRLIWALLAAFAMAIVLGPIVIPWLKRMKFGKEIYELGPESHQKKRGTPQMGGIIFTVPAILATLIFCSWKRETSMLWMALLSALGFGVVGLIDDLIKVKLKRSEGLTPKQKLIPQIVLAFALSAWAYLHPGIGSSMRVPFFNVEWNLGWFYIPAMAFILVGTANSANLLDGLDGLLGGCSAFDFATMAILCMALFAAGQGGANASEGYLNVAIFAGAMVGGLIGFLRYNFHPAKVFMGDVGAFFIGGALAGMTMVTRLSLLLPIIALAMFVSSLSDLIQFAYFRATHGKRFFRMAPLHHHFEKCGWPELKIVFMYYIVTALLCILTLLGFRA